jgi:prolyl-tRNA editing enzyme YbaK/EbsC (Cys-tRNA(Pro) deacylase)
LGSRERVSEYLRSAGVETEMREFDQSTKNSVLAADALGCSVAEIAKSVVFSGDRTVVVVLSGDRKVDPAKLGDALNGPVRVATPDEVRAITGYPVGGVPPFPHHAGVSVIPDTSLLRFDFVWAAGGAPNAVFRIDPRVLVRLAGGATYDVSV